MRSILLIDDDEDDRALFKEAVSSLDHGLQCWTANDGQQALDVLAYELIVLPDLIFLDLNMPKMSGIEFLTAIKKNRQHKNIPVIIYSTSSNPEDLRKCQELGATDFITKPSDFKVLIKTLSTLLNQHLQESLQ
jgi:CheY-like chemotaxis protein